MLVLTRKVYEAIVLDGPNGPIRIVVTSIKGKYARIGIEADPSVKIYREEIIPLDQSSSRVKQAIKDGTPLHELEAQMDWEDNQQHNRSES